MRISLVFLGSTGAGPVYSFEFAKALAERNDCNLQVIISKYCSNMDVWKSYFSKTNVDFHVIDTYKRTSYNVAISFIQIWKIDKLIKLIKRFKPDYTYFPFGLIWSPVVFPKLSRFTKIVYTIHDPHPHDKMNNPFMKYLTYLCKKSYRYIDTIVILNRNDKEYIQHKYGKPIIVIPHASFKYYKNSNSQTFNGHNLNRKIGFIGRIEPYKGVDILVDAFIETKLNICLLIAGKGNIDDVTKMKIESNKNITLLNRYIEDYEFHELLSQIDFVVLPYKRASQSGIIPMAFAMGKTVIATDVGALSEQVPYGVGLLCKPDYKDVANKITFLYNNPKLIYEYNRKALEYAEKELSWDYSSNLLIEFLQKLDGIK